MLNRLEVIIFVVVTSTVAGWEFGSCQRPISRNQTGTCNAEQTMSNEGECLCCYGHPKSNPRIGIGFDLNRLDAEDQLRAYGLNLREVLQDCEHQTLKHCLSNAQALDLFDTVSYWEAKQCVHDNLPHDLTPVRRYAVVDVVHTIECAELLTYTHFLEALRQQKWAQAAERLMETRWSQIVSVERRNSDYTCIRGDDCLDGDCSRVSTTPTHPSRTTKEPTRTTTKKPPTISPPKRGKITCDTLVAFYTGTFAPDPSSTQPDDGTFDARIELLIRADQKEKKIYVSFQNSNASYNSYPDQLQMNIYNKLKYTNCKDPSGLDFEHCSIPFSESTTLFRILVGDTIANGLYNIIYFDDFKNGLFTLTNAIGRCTKDRLVDPSSSYYWPDTTKISYCICCNSYAPDRALECPANPYRSNNQIRPRPAVV